MTQQEIQLIHDMLANRIQPSSAREGAAILALAQKLVAYFAKEFAPKQAADHPQGT